MDNQTLGQLAYLVLLGLAVAGWFITENRRNLVRLARQAAAWGLIFLGVIAAVGLWSDIRDQVLPRQSSIGAGRIEVPRSPDGHFYLVARLDGTAVRFIVDTGASDIVLTRADAARLGIDTGALAFVGRATTANGPVRTAYARVGEMRLGDIVDRDVPVSINDGAMEESLLGMSYLRRFERMEIAGNTLVLSR